MSTREERNAYSKGYGAGMRRAWPAWHPPLPPDPMTAEVLQAAINLAEHTATWCGMFGDEDEFSKEMRPLLEAVDAANEKITAWLQRPAESEEERHG